MVVHPGELEGMTSSGAMSCSPAPGFRFGGEEIRLPAPQLTGQAGSSGIQGWGC